MPLTHGVQLAPSHPSSLPNQPPRPHTSSSNLSLLSPKPREAANWPRTEKSYTTRAERRRKEVLDKLHSRVRNSGANRPQPAPPTSFRYVRHLNGTKNDKVMDVTATEMCLSPPSVTMSINPNDRSHIVPSPTSDGISSKFFQDQVPPTLTIPLSPPPSSPTTTTHYSKYTAIPQPSSSYASQYFGVHHGDMGVLTARRSIPLLPDRRVNSARPRTTGKKSILKGVGSLTPFGQELVHAAEDYIEQSYRLDPAYLNPHSPTTSKYYTRSTTPNDRAVSPLNMDCDMDGLHPPPFGGDDRSVQSAHTHGSYESLNEQHFKPNPMLGAQRGDDDVSVGTRNTVLTRATVGEESRAMFSQSTLGVPRPEMYDQWLPHGKMPPRRSLSRAGLQQGESRQEQMPTSPTGHGADGARARIHSDHGMGPAEAYSDTSFDQASQGASTFAHEEGEAEVGYIVHAAPMGWKLTTPARKRFVEATALLAGYGENECLPMPDKLSDLPDVLGIPQHLTNSLRQGSSGPMPGFPHQTQAVKKNHMRAVTKHLDRTKSAQGGVTLKWMGADSHKAQLRKVDAKLKMTVSSANRPQKIVDDDTGEKKFGDQGYRLKVGGARTAGRRFREGRGGLAESISSADVGGGGLEVEVGGGNNHELGLDDVIGDFDATQMFGKRPASVK